MIAIIETTRARADHDPCDACGEPFTTGQRIALVHDSTGHHWWHIRHVAEPTAPVATERTPA